MYWLTKLKEFKKEANISYRSIAEKAGIPQTTVEKLFSGRTHDPKLNVIDSIAKTLGHSASELLEDDTQHKSLIPEERNLIRDYRKLTPEGKAHVKYTMRREMESMERAAERKSFPVIYYDFPVSAGTGEYLDSTTAAVVELDEEPPRGTSFILRIAGDSMEPEFYNGDYVYVAKAESVSHGEIGIFSYAGSVYMKEYTTKGLRSLNPKYQLIPGSSDICCLGRVLGIVEGQIQGI